jgi:hypothetical protein
MKNGAWPSFSFTDLLRPPDGWKTENAILSTYSADLTVIVTTLLALTGCDLDYRRTGSRVELVKAIEALRGKVCVLAQAGRVGVPSAARPILKLLDRFLQTVTTDENQSSWHPKVALVRYHRVDDPSDRQWRVWIGSRNLTRAMNWETGLILVSRSDGKGQKIQGLAELGRALAERAKLKKLSAADVAAELGALTWECPPGVELRRVRLIGPDRKTAQGFPEPEPDIERAFMISPFLDVATIRAFARWGNPKTRRTIVSTAFELQRLLQEDADVFAGCENVLIQPLPDLPLEGADLLTEEAGATVETSESEELPPLGLHAKLFFAAKGARRQLWMGSANATERGWKSRNFEVVAELSIARDPADALEEFVGTCAKFKPNTTRAEIDKDEEELEKARKLLCSHWSLQQRISETELEVVASAPPPVTDPAIQLEVAALGGSWNVWPPGVDRLVILGVKAWQRSHFLQVRVVRGERVCAWVQIAPCDRPLDEERDHAVIAQYLNPRTFLMWLRSLLADEPAQASGGDWDGEMPGQRTPGINDRNAADDGVMPTVEEILRAWARSPSAVASTGEKVKSYLDEIERRAKENGTAADVKLLQSFRQTWTTMAAELK